jgi:hypothetical protein
MKIIGEKIMSRYAVIENDVVVNVILADTQEIAEQVSGKICIEYTEENPLAIDWYWMEEAGKYISPTTYASWTYNLLLNSWVPPIEMPVEDGKYFTWNEELISWDSHLLEFQI